MENIIKKLYNMWIEDEKISLDSQKLEIKVSKSLMEETEIRDDVMKLLSKREEEGFIAGFKMAMLLWSDILND